MYHNGLFLIFVFVLLTEPNPTDAEVLPGYCYREGRGSDYNNYQNFQLDDNSIDAEEECNRVCYNGLRDYAAIRFRDVR